MTHYETIRMRRRRALNGTLRVPVGPYQAAMTAARTAGIQFSEIAAQAGMTDRGLRHILERAANRKEIYRSSANQIDFALRKLVAQHQNLLEDALDHLDAGLKAADKDWWSSQTLLEWARHHGKKLNGYITDVDRRYIYKSPVVDTNRADRVALALGAMPQDIWPDWHEK